MTTISKTTIDISIPLLQQERIGATITSYLGLHNDKRFCDALKSLEDANKAASENLKSLPKEAFLVGEWGISGVCMAYALETAGWVEKHAGEMVIPPLMSGWPKESIRHLQKLLILAVYQSIGKGVNPQELFRTEQNREAINKIAQNYERLQQRRTGIEMVEKFPGPAFFESDSMQAQADTLELLCQERTLTAKDHFIFIMNPPGRPVFDWHVIYANPTFGIIADAATGLLWKIDGASLDLFHEVFKDFLETQGYNELTATMARLSIGPRPCCHIPLIVSRILRRSQTALSIARHSGPIFGAKYLYVINKHNPLVKRFFPDPKEIDEDIREILQKDGIGKELVIYIRNNLRGTSKLSFEALRDSSALESAFLCHAPDQIRNPQKAEALLATLKEIQELGPKAYAISACLQRKLLNRAGKTDRNGVFPKHIFETFAPEILKLRQTAYGPKFDLDALVTHNYPHEYRLPYFKLLFEAGANPNGDKSYYRYGNSPLDQALDRSDPDQTVIKFFMEHGARPYKEKAKESTHSLSLKVTE